MVSSLNPCQMAEDLIAARALIATPETWCKLAVARNATGGLELARSKDACKWCATGALARACGRSIAEIRVMRAERELVFSAAALGIGEDNRRNLPYLNDTNNHETIMRIFDHAIDRIVTAGDDPDTEKAERNEE